MSTDFPQFDEPSKLDGTRRWTAEFDSYDARNDDCYYILSVDDGGRTIARFVAQISLVDLDDWTTPEFVEAVRRKLQRVAATGQSNTEYDGLPSTWFKAGGRIA
jgi:hypothetical protein